MAQELILIRGLPGSGKSTLAKFLREKLNDACHVTDTNPNSYWEHFETDIYFHKLIGTVGGREIREPYKFIFEELPAAHGWCQLKVRESLEAGYSVIVSNTFSRLWEMQPYLDMAHEFGAKLTVLTCEGNYGNVHNVPEEVISKMKTRWERYPA